MRDRGRLIAAIVAGVAAVALTWFYISSREASLLQQSAPQAVVVATADIPGNSVVQPGTFAVREVPAAFVQPRAVSREEDVQGRVVLVPVPKGTQILATMLGDEGESALAFEVPAGQRAVTIAAANVTGVGGLVRPGNRVDVMGTFDFGRPVGVSQAGVITYADERTETRLLMQDMRVIAVDQQHRRRGAPPRPVATPAEGEEATLAPIEETREIQNVTLLASIRQAQELILAQEVGTLTLALRSNLDAGRVENLQNLDVVGLLGVQVPIKRRPAPSWREMRGGSF
jgi:pilus assembly protein CpaB